MHRMSSLLRNIKNEMALKKEWRAKEATVKKIRGERNKFQIGINQAVIL